MTGAGWLQRAAATTAWRQTQTAVEQHVRSGVARTGFSSQWPKAEKYTDRRVFVCPRRRGNENRAKHLHEDRRASVGQLEHASVTAEGLCLLWSAARVSACADSRRGVWVGLASVTACGAGGEKQSSVTAFVGVGYHFIIVLTFVEAVEGTLSV